MEERKKNVELNFFFLINVGVRTSLHASRLILWILKLTTIKASSDPEAYKTRIGDL
jgi:hypothetical protein